ncbi:MAG: TonB family protein [Candidatus Eremiobacteraeota bacterium]|nr:TonB family protein [Candidatus Eremiobacteraeota bacterium]
MGTEENKEDKVKINITTPRDPNWLDRIFSEEKTVKRSNKSILFLILGFVLFLGVGAALVFFKKKENVLPVKETLRVPQQVPNSVQPFHTGLLPKKNLAQLRQIKKKSEMEAKKLEALQRQLKKEREKLKLITEKKLENEKVLVESAQKENLMTRKAREERLKKEKELAALHQQKIKALLIREEQLKKEEALKKLEEERIKKQKELAFLHQEKVKALMKKEAQLKKQEQLREQEQLNKELQLKKEEAIRKKEQEVKREAATKPVIVSQCVPRYPQFEKDEGIQLAALLLVVIGSSGKVQKVEVKKSSGNFDLDYAAVESVRQCWKFAPATQNGVPVRSTLSVPIRFSL